MKNMKNKIAKIVIVVLLIIFAVYIGVNNPKSENTIKVGFIGPLTGEASPYGVPVKQGIELALKDAIDKGLIKNGQIQIIYEDGKCDSKEAVKAAQKLINVDKVKVIFGGQCSNETMAISPITEQNKILLISSFSTSPDVTKAGDLVFRVPPSDENSGRIIAETIVKDGFKNIGIVSEKALAAQTIVPVFEKKVKELGANLVYNESLLFDSNDVYTIAAKIKSANPEAIYLNVQTGASGSKLVKQLKDLGYEGHIYTYFISGDDFVKSGKWVNGVKIVDFQAAKDSKTLLDFTSHFVSLFGKEPSYPFGATLGYDTGSIMFEAISKVGNNPEKIKDYLYSMPSRPSVTGNLSFDQNGDPIGNDVYYLREVVDNKLVDLK
jgi:branched-chain amino acid transport system substrate-binding protein